MVRKLLNTSSLILVVLKMALLDLQTNQSKVLGEGLEPSHLTAPEPKSGVSANFTTRA